MKQISDLTINDFPYHITTIDTFNIMCNMNISFYMAVHGNYIYWGGVTPNHLYVSYEFANSVSNDSIPPFPGKNTPFIELTNHNEHAISYNDVKTGMGGFNSKSVIKNMYIYFVTDNDTSTPPVFDLKISNTLTNATWSYDKTSSVLTVSPSAGYEISSATLNFNNQSVPLVKQANGTYTLTLTDSYKNSNYTYSLTVNTSEIVYTYTGTVTGNDNVTYSFSNNYTITVTPKTGTLKSLTANVSSYAGGPATSINGTVTNNVGTIVIPKDYLNNSSATLTLNPVFVQTLQSVGVKDETNKNASLSVVNNTMTITPMSGYKISSATFYTTNKYDFSSTPKRNNVTNFNIDSSTGIATLTVDNADTLSSICAFHVEYETEPTKEPTTKYMGSDVQALDHTTITFDGTSSWTLTCDPGYIINELHVDGSIIGFGDKTLDIITPVISADKKSATFTATDKNTLTLYNLSLRGDIAKDTVQPTTPTTPTTPTPPTPPTPPTTPTTPTTPATGTDVVRLYEVDDDTLTTLSKQDFSYYSNGTNVNYDFQQFINQLYKLPFAIPTSLLTSTSQIITGLFTLKAQAYKINQQTYTLDLGKITVPVTNGFDYNLKDIKILLPWVQAIRINASDILGKTLHIVYNVNLLDGSTTIVISSDDVVVNSVKVDISTKVELFNIYSNQQNGSLTSTLQNDLRQAYIKVSYYKPVENLISYPTNEHGTLKDYSGYTQVKNVKLSKSTSAIIDNMIINELKDGVYIK